MYETGSDRIYIVDFFDPENNVLYEIKPIEFYKQEIFKISQAINYSFNHSISFFWINENNILDYVDVNKFQKNNSELLLKFLYGINKKIYDEIKDKFS